jgi:hypothetical protein
MSMDAVWPYLAALLPTLLVATLFYYLIKGMLEGDRRERAAQRRFEAEQDRQGAATDSGTADRDGAPGASHGPGDGQNPLSEP